MWRAFEREIPPFYVASNIRKKLRPPFRNVYCIIRYKNWSRDRPEGTAIKILGEVSDKKATIEYMRYCYNLYTKIYRFPRGFTMPDTTSYITDLPEDDSIIFSVDPPGTLDIDDAFSITLQDGLYDIGIYIADPTHVIDCLLYTSPSPRDS